MIPLKNNHFAFGVVEDSNDPEQRGRVRVRIFAAHTDDLSLIPTSALPWSVVMLPTTSASISGIGVSPTGIVEGTMVGGIFLDGEDRQNFIVMGTFSGSRATNKGAAYGFNDPNGLYPLSGVTTDMNPLATGNTAASTPYTDRETNRVKSLGVDSDPTVAPVVQDNSFYKDAPWMQYAVSQLGINEESNADVIKTYLSVGGGISSSNLVAWCAAFCGWCLNKAGITGTRSALARSYLNYGTNVGTTNVPYGAIAVFSGTRGPSSGHAGFVVKDLGTKITILGGNQTTDQSTGSTVKYDTGGRVTQVNFPKTNLLGCVFPTNLNKTS